MMLKLKPVRSEAYLSYVRSLPCCHCAAEGPNDAHHLIGFGRGTMGGKADDMLAVPLCRECHTKFHHDFGKGVCLQAQVGWLQWTLRRAVADGVLLK